MIKLIVWDWNGTLIDDVDLAVNLFNEILIQRNLDTIDRNYYQKYIGVSLRSFLSRTGLLSNGASAAEIIKQFIAKYELRTEEVKLQEKTIDAIHLLKLIGINQCVVSLTTQKILNNLVSKFGLSKYFVEVKGLSRPFDKEKSQLLRDVSYQMGVIGSEILLIGDTVNDANAAREIGARCILYSRGHQIRYQLFKEGIPVVDNLTDIQKFL